MKFIIHWIIYSIAIAITAYILPGVHVGGVLSVMILAIVLGAINTFIKPIFVLLTIPLTIFSLGLFILVINALLILLAAWVVPGFLVSGFWWALLFSLILSIINSFLQKVQKKDSSNKII